jgi:outer membrane protein assembly factor BamC
MDMTFRAQLCVTSALCLLALSGCSLNPLANKDAVDYRSASKGPQLDVPPDLTQPRFDDRYKSTTAVGAAAGAAPGAIAVLPKIDNVRIERLGNERWLVVNQRVEAVWPAVRSFWQESGFSLTVDRADIGVLETDWVENRAKIQSDPVRNLLGKVLDNLYSSGTRDRYRIRLERGTGDSTEIYVSHRGLEERPVGPIQQGSAGAFAWGPRAADPGLEAEMLNRMLVRLGVPAAQAQQVASSAATSAQALPAAQNSGASRARMNSAALEVDDPFDRAWRRVGLALDRVGFTVVDRDRTQGIYYVRYADERGAADKGGILERMKFWKGDEPPPAEQYRVVLKETAGKTNAVVLDKNGAATPKSLSDRILLLLVDQLK